MPLFGCSYGQKERCFSQWSSVCFAGVTLELVSLNGSQAKPVVGCMAETPLGEELQIPSQVDDLGNLTFTFVVELAGNEGFPHTSFPILSTPRLCLLQRHVHIHDIDRHIRTYIHVCISDRVRRPAGSMQCV